MALITGGMSGLGMVASYEHAMAGRERIVAVTKSPHLTPGEQEAHLLDVIQDVSTHYIIRCDIGDGGAWTDALAFANNISAHDEYDPQSTMKDSQTLLKQMDSLDVIDVLIASLRGMIEAGSPIDGAKLNRVLFFRNNMSRGLKETMEKFRTQPLDKDNQERIFQFQDCLRELSELIELFRKRGLVEEQPGGSDPSMGGLFPGEAAATAPTVGGGAQPEGKPAVAAKNTSPSPAGEGKAEGGGGGDSLFELMERELLQKQAKQRRPPNATPAPQASPAGFLDQLDAVEAMPEPAPRTEAAKAKEAPKALSHPCEACGAECAISCTRCSECQRTAEKGALAGAIRRAKEDARLKAQREAERQARREVAGRKVQQEAESKSKAKEEAGRRAAQEELARKERREALERAKAEAERKAREATQRQAQEEALRQEAEDIARQEAEQRSLDDIVCPQGHALCKFPVQRGFPCDLCGAESVSGATMWGCRNKNERDCRTCDFDICSGCSSSRTRRSLRASGQAV